MLVSHNNGHFYPFKMAKVVLLIFGNIRNIRNIINIKNTGNTNYNMKNAKNIFNSVILYSF